MLPVHGTGETKKKKRKEFPVMMNKTVPGEAEGGGAEDEREDSSAVISPANDPPESVHT